MARRQTNLTQQESAGLLSDREIWTGALTMIERYGANAVSEARTQLRVFATEDELDAQLAWLRIIEAILWLQDDHPPRSRLTH